MLELKDTYYSIWLKTPAPRPQNFSSPTLYELAQREYIRTSHETHKLIQQKIHSIMAEIHADTAMLITGHPRGAPNPADQYK